MFMHQNWQTYLELPILVSVQLTGIVFLNSVQSYLNLWQKMQLFKPVFKNIQSFLHSFQVIMIQLPLLIPSILGLLCVILVPIITFTFCCCRCCCRNCGVKLGMRDIKNQKATPYILNIFIVVIFVGILW